jgi:superfamily II DNA or RNA helicase
MKEILNIGKLISDSSSYDEFYKKLSKLSLNKKYSSTDIGNIFEKFCKLYLQTKPQYKLKFKNVWLHNKGETPKKVCKYLNLPGPDFGIDIICETNQGEFWSVQSKFRSAQKDKLILDELDGFMRMSYITCKNISFALVMQTIYSPPKNINLFRDKAGFLSQNNFYKIDDFLWKTICEKIKNKNLIPKPHTPKPHQRLAIQDGKKHFEEKKNTRGKLIMPCATGKTLIGYWISQELKCKKVIVALPSIALVSKTMEVWALEFLSQGIKPDMFCVCSSRAAGKIKNDDFVQYSYDLGFEVASDTDEKRILRFLKKKSKIKVIFTTYQSGEVLCKASKKAKINYDLAIMDEAHNTAGHKDKEMGMILHEKNIRIKKRIFMTATERVIRRKSDDIVSMNKEEFYGKVFHQLSFKRAIDKKIISDYDILTFRVNDQKTLDTIDKNKFLKIKKIKKNVLTARDLAVSISIRKSIKKNSMKKIITFHSDVDRAEDFKITQEAISNNYSSDYLDLDSFHVSSRMNMGLRDNEMKNFENSNRSIITNARCLTEGIDVPAVDCVTFVDPKTSKIDIVQAAGRALRLSPETNKKKGYILVPIIVPRGKNLLSVTEKSAFKEIVYLVAALSTMDERIKEDLKLIYSGKKPRRGSPIKSSNFEHILKPTNLKKFEEKISIEVWKKIGKFHWEPYEVTKKIAQDNNINSNVEWRAFANSEKKPPNVPHNPEQVYLEFTTWAEFLGTENYYSLNQKAKKFNIKVPNYNEAKKIIEKFNFISLDHYVDWVKKQRKDNPESKEAFLPLGPDNFYKEFETAPEFLGRKKNKFLNYGQAKDFLKEKNITSNIEFQKVRKKEDWGHLIPSNPQSHYEKFEGWEYFLGKRDEKRLDYKKASKLSKEQGFEKVNEWKKFQKKNKDLLPAVPDREYADDWTGWWDFAGIISAGAEDEELKKIYLPFKDARKFVRNKKLKNVKEWRKWAGSEKRPYNIHKNPDGLSIYENEWISWPDWLGTDNVVHNLKSPNISKAKKIVKKNKIINIEDYVAFVKANRKSKDKDIANLPTDPRTKYGKKFKGYPDFFGRKNLSNMPRK